MFIVFGAIGYLGFSIYTQLREKQEIEKRIAILPEFSAADLEGNIVNTEGIKNSSLVFTYFNTGCEFCKAGIRSMKEHELLQQSAFIWLVSDEPKNVLKEFAKAFELDSLQSMMVLHDSTREIKELFAVKGVPNIFVYQSGKLLKNFKGETKAEVLYELIK